MSHTSMLCEQTAVHLLQVSVGLRKKLGNVRTIIIMLTLAEINHACNTYLDKLDHVQ